MTRDVQVSKKLSWLLRHGAEQEGLQFQEAGFLNVQDVLSNRNFRSLKVTFDEIRQVVQDNDKQRFTLVPVSTQSENVIKPDDDATQPPIPSENAKDWLIRANQGHSLKVEAEGLLQPIVSDSLPEQAVHGTTHAAWPLIVASGGLKPMGRNHVHFASGLPAGFSSLSEFDPDKESVQVPVISGMRKSSTVLIFLDMRRAIDAGITFWRSDNGVFLTEGNEEGIVPLELFRRVEDRTGEGLLVENGKVVKDFPDSWKGKSKGKG